MVTRGDYATAFVEEYVLQNSQRSPVTTELYVFALCYVWFALACDAACMLIQLQYIDCTRICARRYVEYYGFQSLFAAYKQEVLTTNLVPLTKSYFYKKWRAVMRAGVVDPDTGISYKTRVRVNFCRGFSKCDDCSLLQAQITVARQPSANPRKMKTTNLHVVTDWSWGT